MRTINELSPIKELLEWSDAEITQMNIPKARSITDTAERMLRKKYAFSGIDYVSGKVCNYLVRIKYLIILIKEIIFKK